MSEPQRVTDEQLATFISLFKDGEECPFCAGILPIHKGVIAGSFYSRCSGGDALLFAKTLVRERELIDRVLQAIRFSSAHIIQDILVERKRP